MSHSWRYIKIQSSRYYTQLYSTNLTPGGEWVGPLILICWSHSHKNHNSIQLWPSHHASPAPFPNCGVARLEKGRRPRISFLGKNTQKKVICISTSTPCTGSPGLKRERFTSPQRWILGPSDYSLEREPFITRRRRALTRTNGSSRSNRLPSRHRLRYGQLFPFPVYRRGGGKKAYAPLSGEMKKPDRWARFGDQPMLSPIVLFWQKP